jgi:SAM-dependent methyltransferase
MSLIYGLVIFVSAYLLFQVQPLTSKSILPWFGGTPSVWTTCMLFFQILLFAGYFYAHILSSRFSPKTQLIVHSILMLVAITASVIPDAGWKPTGAENPTLRIVMMLGACIGLPFFVLSSTGPLVQNWFSRAQEGRSPWHLYALSNVGSLLGLLLYPFFVEIQFDLPEQGSLWKWGFVVFVAGCGFCGWNFAKKTANKEVKETMGVAEPPTLLRKLLWFFLAAVPSTMLLATTNQVCLDVASIPFLWILPLTLYLLTFILSFAGDRWYFRKTCSILLPISLVALVGMMIADAGASLELQLIGYFAALFFTAMCCHGELVRAKPTPHHLTTFYLWMSAGGAAGGLFVGLIAPLVFDLYLELHVAILAAMVLMGIVWSNDHTLRWYDFWRTPGVIFFSIAISMTLLLKHEVDEELESAIQTSRSFYGVLRIRDVSEEFDIETPAMFGKIADPNGGEKNCVSFAVPVGSEQQRDGTYQLESQTFIVSAEDASGESLALATAPNPEILPEPAPGFQYITYTTRDSHDDAEFTIRREVVYKRTLLNGRILHGNQFLVSNQKRWPTTYYSYGSAVGIVNRTADPTLARHIGVVGLGTGTMAAYGDENDRVTFYEINEDVIRIAGAGAEVFSATGEPTTNPAGNESYFSYLDDCPGEVRIVLGDARLALERAEPEQFDLLALDAFSSDAIPAHLLTKEATKVYLKHLKPNGILAVHISNRHFDLEPVVAGIAEELNLADRYVFYDDEPYRDDAGYVGASDSEWVLLTRDASAFEGLSLEDTQSMNRDKLVLWTDAYSNLVQVLRTKDLDNYKDDFDSVLKSVGLTPLFDEED